MSERGGEGGGDRGRKRGPGRDAGAGRRGEPDRVGDLLGGFLDRMGIAEGVARQSALERWEEVAGPQISAVTRPTAVSGEVLFVRVASSAWLAELDLLKHDILKTLNAGRTAGRIERIVFSLWERAEGEEGS